MAEKKCTGDCLQCSLPQQVYCSAQHCHAMHEMMCEVFEKLNAMTSTPSGIINPLETTQKGSGEENREPEVKSNNK